MNLDSSDLLGSPAGNNSSAMSHTSMDSVDLLSSPGAISLSSLGQIHEDEPPQEKSSVPPQEAFAEEQHNGEYESQSSDKPIIFQLEFDVDHVGRNKPASKRMASFKYGIKRASSTKIEEHEAQLTWSTHSGRWCVSVDGSEVYSGQAKGSVLDYKWKWNHKKACVTDNYGMEDGEPIVSMRMVACRKPPVRTSKEFRCYEFVIEGKPFRHLPTVGTGYDEMDFDNENAASDGKLTTILDIVEPSWRAQGFV
eukprot:scaffold15073_cov72-Cyclotella_meneghiniana.AAC.13